MVKIKALPAIFSIFNRKLRFRSSSGGGASGCYPVEKHGMQVREESEEKKSIVIPQYLWWWSIRLLSRRETRDASSRRK
jgi:hypothetical protein